jgi:hypothetical protein
MSDVERLAEFCHYLYEPGPMGRRMPWPCSSPDCNETYTAMAEQLMPFVSARQAEAWFEGRSAYSRGVRNNPYTEGT